MHRVDVESWDRVEIAGLFVPERASKTEDCGLSPQ